MPPRRNRMGFGNPPHLNLKMSAFSPIFLSTGGSQNLELGDKSKLKLIPLNSLDDYEFIKMSCAAAIILQTT